MSGMVLAIALLLCVLSGCSSKPIAESRHPNPTAPASMQFVPVQNPVRELCTDDTLSHTEWFNHPVVVFSGNVIQVGGQAATLESLRESASKYYEHKAERVMWVQIGPNGKANAERATKLLSRQFPDLQVRQVEYGFTCPKLK